MSLNEICFKPAACGNYNNINSEVNYNINILANTGFLKYPNFESVIFFIIVTLLMNVCVLVNIFNGFVQVQLNPLVDNFCPNNKQSSIRFSKKLKGNLNCVYSNLQGMLEACHLDEFINEVLKSNEVHLCAITETW